MFFLLKFLPRVLSVNYQHSNYWILPEDIVIPVDSKMLLEYAHIIRNTITLILAKRLVSKLKPLHIGYVVEMTL